MRTLELTDFQCIVPTPKNNDNAQHREIEENEKSQFIKKSCVRTTHRI